MKANLLFLVLITTPFFVSAQANTCLLKTYAYSRTVLGGAPPADVVELGGNVIKAEAKNNKQYYIYLKTCYVSQVTVTSVWIQGTSYSAKAEKAKTPVILTNTSLSTKGLKETLVSKTASNVWEIMLERDDTMLKPAPSMQQLIKSNAIVITGILKGKSFSTFLKNIKELEPLAAL